MDPLGYPLRNRPIQTGWEFNIHQYPSWRFGCIGNQDCQFGNSSGWTQNRTQSDGPKPLLTLGSAGWTYVLPTKKSRAQNKKMTAVGYILDTEEILKASWSLFQHDGAAAFKLLERSPLPPPLAPKDLLGGWTQILNVCPIWRINCHPVESDDDSAPEKISDTEHRLNCNVDLDNPNDSEVDCAADVGSHIEQDNSIEDPDYPK